MDVESTQDSSSVGDNHSAPDPLTFDPMATENNKMRIVVDSIIETMESSSKRLKSFRLVNSLWKQVATIRLKNKNWRERNFLRFTNDEITKEYLDTISSPLALASPENQQLFSCFIVEREIRRRFSEVFEESDPESENDESEEEGEETATDIEPFYDKELMLRFFEALSSTKSALCLDFVFDSMEQLDSIIMSQGSSLKELKIFIKGALSVDNNDNDNDNRNEDSKLINLDYLCLTLDRASYSYKNKNDVFSIDTVTLSVMKTVLNRIPSPSNKSSKSKLKICLTHWSNINSTITMLEEFGLIKNLKILHIQGNSLKEGELKLLAQAGVSLQFFAFESSPVNAQYSRNGNRNPGMKMTQDKHEEVFEFLESQLNTLQVLSLASYHKFKFPPGGMNVLKKLRLHCQVSRFRNGSKSESETESDYEDADEDDNSSDEDEEKQSQWDGNNAGAGGAGIFYKSMFPQLEELQLFSQDTHSAPEFRRWFLQPQPPCNTVKKLKIDCPTLNGKILRFISKTFPFLTSLNLDCGGKALLQTYKETENNIYNSLWGALFSTTLQELFINLPQIRFNLDGYFSGLTKRQIERISSSEQYKKNFDISHEIFLNGRNSILNFKSLKKLVVTTSDYSDKVKGRLTDFSAFALFGQLSNLYFLHLDDTTHAFTPRALKYLSSKKIHEPVSVSVMSSEERIEQVFRTGFDTIDCYEYEYERYNQSEPELLNLLTLFGKCPKCCTCELDE